MNYKTTLAALCGMATTLSTGCDEEHLIKRVAQPQVVQGVVKGESRMDRYYFTIESEKSVYVFAAGTLPGGFSADGSLDSMLAVGDRVVLRSNERRANVWYVSPQDVISINGKNVDGGGVEK